MIQTSPKPIIQRGGKGKKGEEHNTVLKVGHIVQRKAKMLRKPGTNQSNVIGNTVRTEIREHREVLKRIAVLRGGSDRSKFTIIEQESQL